MEYLDYLNHHKKEVFGEVLGILRQEQEESETKNRF